MVFGILFYTAGRDKLVGETILVSSFTSDGTASGKVLVQVPFVRGLPTTETISVVVDTNQDGKFTADENLISEFPVMPKADWRNGYYAVSDDSITSGMKAQVTIGGKNYVATVDTKIVEVGPVFDLGTVTDPENSMKGWGMSIAYAQDNSVEINQEGVPDLSQRTGECAPTAATNSLISLVARNGGGDLIPGDPLGFLEKI